MTSATVPGASLATSAALLVGVAAIRLISWPTRLRHHNNPPPTASMTAAKIINGQFMMCPSLDERNICATAYWPQGWYVLSHASNETSFCGATPIEDRPKDRTMRRALIVTLLAALSLLVIAGPAVAEAKRTVNV